MTVPYLAHPPKVIPVDVGRQSFVDDFLIEKTNLKRTYHRAEKHAGNPVFVPQTQEQIKRSAVVFLGQGGVNFDPLEAVFKMFYIAGWRGSLAMAFWAPKATWAHRSCIMGGFEVSSTPCTA